VLGVWGQTCMCARGVGMYMYVCVRAVGTVMCVCVRGVDFASVSLNFRVEFGTVPIVWYFFVFHYIKYLD
jgi:hypothetical protein